MRLSVEACAFTLFVYGVNMCDLLKKSALAYSELSAYEYILICGRKGVQSQVTIRFPDSAYHHLAGFQYSRLAALKHQKTALATVLSGRVTHAQLLASGFQHNDRLESLTQLRRCLEANQFVFRYNSRPHPYSRIKAEYLMLFEDIVFFTDGTIPVSIFKNHSVDYQEGCPQLTVLQIRKIHLATGEVTVTYQRKSFQDG